MTLIEFVPPTPHPLWKLCRQMGIDDVVVKVNPSLTGLPDPWRLETLKEIVDRLAAAGLRVVALEGDPFDMSPIKEFGATGETPVVPVREGRAPARPEALDHYCELLESMGALGIRLLCYNFMVGTGWARTGVREGRGGARATYFSLHEELGGSRSCATADAQERVPPELKLTDEQVWANYEYFITRVMPVAERAGVRMGLHPDDPCLPELGGYARIFGSVEAYDRAYALYPSPSNAVTFCQANFKLMLGRDKRDPPDDAAALAEVARHFGKRIAFIHVRDVDGTKEDFTELFHDQGSTDQFALMRVYRELGLDVPVRGDHVPEMEGDRRLTEDCIPGYFTLGRLFANGYLKALLAGTANP